MATMQLNFCPSLNLWWLEWLKQMLDISYYFSHITKHCCHLILDFSNEVIMKQEIVPEYKEETKWPLCFKGYELTPKADMQRSSLLTTWILAQCCIQLQLQLVKVFLIQRFQSNHFLQPSIPIPPSEYTVNKSEVAKESKLSQNNSKQKLHTSPWSRFKAEMISCLKSTAFKRMPASSNSLQFIFL